MLTADQRKRLSSFRSSNLGTTDLSFGRHKTVNLGLRYHQRSNHLAADYYHGSKEPAQASRNPRVAGPQRRCMCRPPHFSSCIMRSLETILLHATKPSRFFSLNETWRCIDIAFRPTHGPAQRDVNHHRLAAEQAFSPASMQTARTCWPETRARYQSVNVLPSRSSTDPRCDADQDVGAPPYYSPH